MQNEKELTSAPKEVKRKGIIARFERPKGEGGKDSIAISLPDGTKTRLWVDVVELGAKGLSPNERKTVIALLEKEIDSLSGGNCPSVFREMLWDLKDYNGEARATEKMIMEEVDE